MKYQSFLPNTLGLQCYFGSFWYFYNFNIIYTSRKLHICISIFHQYPGPPDTSLSPTSHTSNHFLASFHQLFANRIVPDCYLAAICFPYVTFHISLFPNNISDFELFHNFTSPTFCDCTLLSLSPAGPLESVRWATASSMPSLI